MVRIFGWIIWAWLASITSVAWADAKDEARILFDAGVAASRAERWREASEYFHRSLTLAEKPSTWFNLAVANIKQGQGRAGLEALEAFERSANAKDHADMFARVPALRTQAEALPEAPALAAPREPEPVSASEDASPIAPRLLEPERVPRHDPVVIATSRVDVSRALTRPRRVLTAGIVGMAISLGALGWLVERTVQLRNCETSSRCFNAHEIEHQHGILLGVGLGLSLISASTLAVGATWLAREKRRGELPIDAQVRLGPSTRALQVSFRF